MLVASNIKKQIGQKPNAVEILHGVSLTVADDEMLAIMGPSGCGKSTLLGILAGLDTPTSGSVVFDGQDINAIPKNRRDSYRCQMFSVAFQSQNLVSELTCEQNVSVPLIFNRTQVHRTKAMSVEESLELVGLPKKGKLYPYQMSGGEQQRAAIARALISGAKILFADEPTGALDQANGNAVVRLLRESVKRQKSAVVLVTHDQSIAAQCDRIVSMRDGYIL